MLGWQRPAQRLQLDWGRLWRSAGPPVAVLLSPLRCRNGAASARCTGQALDAAGQPLLTALNETRTLYPGTNLRLVDEFVSATASGEPAAARSAAT